MSTKIKIYLLSFLVWIVSIKIFLTMAFYAELWLIWKYNPNWLDFYTEVLIFLKNLLTNFKTTLLLLSLIFTILLFYFYYTFFWISYNKLNGKLKINHKKHLFLGNLFAFLGFGCFACGQTLLYSVVLFLGAGASASLTPIIGQISLLLGIGFLSWGIYKNLQLKNSPNTCKF